MRNLCLLLLLCSCAAPVATTTPLAFSADTVSGPGGGRAGELYMPHGNGPFPAMVVLHGCDGVGPHYRSWAQQLQDWGYAALLVDSFRPRGVLNVCNHGMEVPFRLQAEDGLRAARYLRTLPEIRADSIGVIGFSHGGQAVLDAVQAATVEAAQARPFAAAVAYYPGCPPPHSALVTDTLILMGDADDWTPPRFCRRWIAAVERNGHALQMQVYPGAVHAFDSLSAPHVYLGHHVGRDPAAATASASETEAFLEQHLSR